MLDRIYATEQGIPDGQKYRYARARTEDEKQAVDAVLSDFFTLSEGVWFNQRACDEIEKASCRISSAQENGKRGGRPPKKPSPSETETQSKPSPSETETQSKPSPSETETQSKAHQTPDTNHQTPITSKPVDDTQGISPSRAGAVCVALRAEGMASVNPQHPELLALLDDGAEIQEFVSAARIASEKGKGFAYAIGIVKGQRADAQRMAEEARAKPRKEATHERHDVEEPA